jgi:hypothetical protein
MTSIEIAKPMSDEFFSDVLITAFDGAYGASWNWFRWAACDGHTGSDYDHDEALVIKHHPTNSSEDIWLAAHVRMREETGYALIDGNPHIVIDHEAIAQGISRIVNDDYLNLWREANAREVEQIQEELRNCEHAETCTEGPLPYGGNRMWRRNPMKPSFLEVETGETARGLRSIIAGAIADEEAGDIDAYGADAIVQCAAFGKVIFS